MAWAAEGTVARTEAKLCFLVLMCVEAALVQGGTARVSRHGRAWRIEARGSGMRADPGVWALLTGERGVPSTSATVQFALAARTARATGIGLSVDMSPDHLVVLATPE